MINYYKMMKMMKNNYKFKNQLNNQIFINQNNINNLNLS